MGRQNHVRDEGINLVDRKLHFLNRLVALRPRDDQVAATRQDSSQDGARRSSSSPTMMVVVAAAAIDKESSPFHTSANHSS